MKLLGGKLSRGFVLLLSIRRDNVYRQYGRWTENPSEQLDQKCAKRQKQINIVFNRYEAYSGMP
jgi:hypothetical protein